MEVGGNGAIVDPQNGGSGTLLVLQLKPIATYKSNDEYLVAMKEDLADWFTCLYKLTINVDNFFEVLETGVMLCEHANKVRNFANEQKKMGLFTEMHSNFVRDIKIPQYEVQYRINVKPQTFQARDNISNFITWTKKLGIPDVLCFETDDLVLRKNEKSVVLCLLEIARVGAKLGMLAPTLVKMEEEIDAEIAGEPPKQIKTCDVKSLHEMVKELAGRCTCPVQFPIIKVGEGKYKIGDSQTLVFVRILRNHVMIRVGGGWDTLEHYLDKHDPCRCGFAGHKSQPIQRPVRRSSTGGTSHSQSTPNTPRSPRKMSVGPNVSLCSGNTSLAQRPASPARMRSMSPSPASSPRKLPSQPTSVNKSSTSQNSSITTGQQKFSVQTQNTRRSQSPVPSKFRSPSPSPAISRTAQVTTTTPSRSQVVPVKRCTSPAQSKRCVSPSPAKRCTSPAPNRGCASPGPSRKPSSLSVARSKPTTPHTERRQLPRRPSGSMDSSGNICESTDLSPDMNSSVSMDAISTMTLDQFKNLLSNALSVPNGHNSESSLDSPRSQSSTDSLRQTYSINSGKKKSSFSDATSKYKTWSSRRDISKRFDSESTTKQERTLKSSNSQDSEYYELDKPPKRAPAVSTISRPKTPVSGVQRPKTPVSSTSVSRPKTPTAYSNIRPTTPVNTASRPKTPTSNVTSKIDTGLSTFKRPTAAPLSFTRPKTPTRLQSKTETAESHQTLSVYRKDSDESCRQSLSIYEAGDVDSEQQILSSEKENDSRLSNLATKTYDSDKDSGYYSSLKPENDSRQSNVFNRSGSEPPQQYGSCRRSSDTYVSNIDTHCDEQGSTVISKPESESRPSSLSFASRSNNSSKTDLTSTSDTKPPSPNIGYVTLKSEDLTDTGSDVSSKIRDTSYFSKTYQNFRRLSMEGQSDAKPSVSNSVSDSSLNEKSDSVRSGSVERSFGTSRQGSSYSVASSSSLKEESSYGNKETTQSSVRSNSFSRESEERDIEKKEIVPRPSTPARPCTPSLIPRPSTPSLIPRPSTPLSNLKDSIDKLERQPAYSNNSSTKNTPGRPPTPRKATILAKSPSANATDKSAKEGGNDSSYTSMFLSRRSKTPGPVSRTSNVTVATQRRSRTPGPGERSGSYESLRKSDDLRTSFDNSENRTVQRPKPVPSSPAVQRRPRTPSTESKPLTRQSSSEGTTVITVNRSSGKHTLTVEDKNETKPALSVRPSGARIIARSPTAQLQRNAQQQENDRSRGRARTKSATPQDRPPRPRSVDPEAFDQRESHGEQVLDRDKNGSHFHSNRMEAWVESAVKNTASKTVVKATKRLPPRPQRSKTPNPRDFHDYELQSRPLEEIKAALSLPVNGLKEVDTDTLDAPPEDPEMYAKMDELFQKLKEKELKASVNETPGSGPGGYCSNGVDCNDVVNSDELSLDSNENVKRRRSSKGSSSYRQSPSSSNKSSVPNTPTRSKASSFSREGSQVSRASSTPPRPPTPTRSGSASRRSSTNSYTSSNSVPVADYNVHRTQEDNATLLVSKLKEMITTKPRPEDKSGFKSRIPAPKSLSTAGKSRSFSNLSSANVSESKPNRQLSNGSLNKENYYYEDDCGQELTRYSSNGDVVDYTGYNDTIRSGNETPVPKLTMPLTTGRTEFLNNQRDANNRTPKLVRAVSISSLSSSSNTLSYTVGDEEEFV